MIVPKNISGSVKKAFYSVFDEYMEKKGFLKKSGAYYRLQGDYLQCMALDVAHGYDCYVKTVSLPYWFLSEPKNKFLDFQKCHLTDLYFDSLFILDPSHKTYWEAVESTDKLLCEQCFESEFLNFKDDLERTIMAGYDNVCFEKDILLLYKKIGENIIDYMNVYFDKTFLEFLYLCAVDHSWIPFENLWQENDSYLRRKQATRPNDYRLLDHWFDSFDSYFAYVKMVLSRSLTGFPPFSNQDDLFHWIIERHDKNLINGKEIICSKTPRLAKAFGIG